jgi:protease-4
VVSVESGDERNNQSGSGGRSRRRGLIIGGAIAFALVLLTAGTVVLVLVAGPSEVGGGGAPSTETYKEEYVSGEGAEKIAVVPVQGQLGASDDSLGGVAQATTPEGLRDALRQAEEDESVAAVILEIDSPGGGVTASDEMHQNIVDFKESSEKPVVVSMGPTAASGGYYISTPADSIVANETTLTGSLGVILALIDVSEAAEDLGIEREIVKSGEFKDIGSPFRSLSPEERDILQSIVNESYDQFVEVIVEGRDLPEERVREIADGRLYSGRQALELGLVDELGNLDTAVEVSRRLADVEEATVVRYVKTPGFADLLRARLAPPEPEAVRVMRAAGMDLTPELKYLYRPGL